VLLHHLPSNDSLADTVKLLYVSGITVGFLLQIAPLFFHFDRKVAQTQPSLSYGFRAAITAMACIIGYYGGNFATFLNLQGAIFGTLISYVLPGLFFLQMLRDAKV
jgi:Transmembrane amino acid transporter protein